MDSLTFGSSSDGMPPVVRPKKHKLKRLEDGVLKMTPPAVQIEAELENLSRNPFKRVLQGFLEGAPASRDIAKLSEKSPDRWAQAVAITAKLAGYNDKLEIEAKRTDQLSDADIDRKINELVQAEVLRLTQTQGNTASVAVTPEPIEAEAVEILENASGTVPAIASSVPV